MNPDTIKKNYDRKLWSKAQVRVAVREGVITADEYWEITGRSSAAMHTNRHRLTRRTGGMR